MKYPGTESSTLEFKERIPEKQQIVKTILGFCNLYGGRLVIGVSDDGSVKGIPDEKVEVVIETVSASILDSCSPRIVPQVYSQRLGERLVVIVEVSSGMNKPYFLASAGMAKGTFVRIGNRTIRATQETIEELQWQSRGRAFDELAVYDAGVGDLDLERVAKTLGSGGKSGVTPSDRFLRSYKICVSEHARTYPSVGGVLLFGREPQKFLSEAFVICTHFSGTNGRKVLATRDCAGNLFEQFNVAYEFVIGRLNRAFEVEGKKRKEILEIPEVALREALVNAVVHRNYNIASSIKVGVFDDRIEIFSPGIFPGPIDPNRLEMGITYIRNVVVAKAFRAAGYIEKLGSGLITILDSYAKRGLQRPQIAEGNGFVKCVLPRKKGREKSRGISEEIRSLFRVADEISVGDVIRELHLSRATASRRLRELVDKGMLNRVGRGRGSRYRLK